jgi:tRNA/rRNA methyltransferase
VAGAVADCTWVLATTARPRDMTKTVYTPEAAMAECARRIAAGEKVAVLFGPERAGLENEDVAQANAIVSVPVNPAFASLNLAQCVLLCAYEWQRATGEASPEVEAMAGTELAQHHEVDHLARHYEERMEEAGFFFPETKAPAMKTNLRNMWSRLPLTRADVQMLHGMMRQIVRWKDRNAD